MAWKWGAIMPHPPVLVPEVGRGREFNASETLHGIECIIRELSSAETKPDYILLLSPHGPHAINQLAVNKASRVSGSFELFGAPDVTVELFVPSMALETLIAYSTALGIPMRGYAISDITKDHGSLVPLYFLNKCWGSLPPVIFMNPAGLTLEQSLTFGKILDLFDDGKEWGFVASGDLSHCLRPGAPAGYHEAGPELDGLVIQALKAGDPSILTAIPVQRLQEGKECGVRSILAFMGLFPGPIEPLSYEGPFGVGYCTAIRTSPTKNSSTLSVEGASSRKRKGFKGSAYPALARHILKQYLAGEGNTSLTQSEVQALVGGVKSQWSNKRACFVTIKKEGKLRGCTGTLLPVQASLAQEIMVNAVSAAMRDGRFQPLQTDELSAVTISVDVLSALEVVHHVAQLDVKKYGVIVTKDGQRGLLLPDLEGVDTIAKQLTIAARKGGMPDIKGAVIHRFTVDRYCEEGQ